MCHFAKHNIQYTTSIINLAFEVAASVMGCTPYYMPSKVDNLRYCTGDEATDFVKVVHVYTLFDESGTARAQTLGTGPSLFIDGPELRVCTRAVPLSSKCV